MQRGDELHYLIAQDLDVDESNDLLSVAVPPISALLDDIPLVCMRFVLFFLSSF